MEVKVKKVIFEGKLTLITLYGVETEFYNKVEYRIQTVKMNVQSATVGKQ